MSGRPAPGLLPAPVRGPLGLIAALAALVVLAFGIAYTGHSLPGAVDRWVLSPTADPVGPPWRHVARAMDFLGEPGGAVLVVTATAAAFLLLRRPRAAILVVAAPVLSVAATTLLKPVVGRTIHGPANLSYPSGHTAFLTALALVPALVLTGRLRLGRTAGTLCVLGAALVAGGAMGWAQVALGAHYPTDVLGGWCAALAVTPAAAWSLDRIAGARGRRRC